MLNAKTLAGVLLAVLLAACIGPGYSQDTGNTRLDKGQILIGKLTDKRTCVAIRAAKLLGDARETRAVDALLAMIKSDKWQLKSAAAYALGKIGDKRAIDPLIGLLDDTATRLVAATALGELKATKAAKPLLALVESTDNNLGDDYAIIQALSQIGDPSVVSVLLRRDSLDSQLIIDACKAIGSPAVDPLLEGLNDEEHLMARHRAIQTLGEVGDKRATVPLLSLLEDPLSDFPLIMHSLAKLNDPRASQALSRMALDPGVDPLRRAEATEAYGETMAADAVRVLAPLLQSEDEDIRQGAARGLARSGDPRGLRLAICSYRPETEDAAEAGAVDWLLQDVYELKGKRLEAWLQLLSDPDPLIHGVVLSALERFDCDDGRYIAALRAQLWHPDPAKRLNALYRLLNQSASDKNIADALAGLADDPDDLVRSTALDAAYRVPADKADSIRARFAHDKQGYIRLRVVRQLQPEKNVTLLVNALHDVEPGVRRTAAEVLGFSHSPRAAAPLTRLLKDQDPDVRFSAICSLVNLGYYSKLPEVLSAFDGENAYQMRRAYTCISKISDPRAPEALRPFQKDERLHDLVTLAMAQSGDPEAAKELAGMFKAQLAQSAAEMKALREAQPPDPGEPVSDTPAIDDPQPDVPAGEDMSADTPEVTTDYSGDSPDETAGEYPAGDDEGGEYGEGEGCPDEPASDSPEDMPAEEECSEDPMTSEMLQDALGPTEPVGLDPTLIIQALATAHEASAVKAVLELVTGKEHDFMPEGVIALGVMKDKSVVDDVIKLLDNDNAQARWDAAWILAQIDDDRARDALMTGLNEWDVEVVGGGATYFISNGIEAAVPVIADALSAIDEECIDTEFVDIDKDLIDGCLLCGNRELVKIIKQYIEDNHMRAPFGGDAAWGSPYPRWGVPVSREPGTRSDKAKLDRCYYGDEECGDVGE